MILVTTIKCKVTSGVHFLPDVQIINVDIFRKEDVIAIDQNVENSYKFD